VLNNLIVYNTQSKRLFIVEYADLLYLNQLVKRNTNQPRLKKHKSIILYSDYIF
jgi:hypothetical protein